MVFSKEDKILIFGRASTVSWGRKCSSSAERRPIPKNWQQLTGKNDSSLAASEPVSKPHGELHVFNDEKLFNIAAPTNSQNDRFYVRPGTRKKNVNKNRFLRTRLTFSKSVMLSVGISKLSSALICILSSQVSKWMGHTIATTFLPRSYYQTCTGWPRTNFLYSNRTAPWLIEHATIKKCRVAFLERETPDFIPPTMWPPNSPDLNPVDYSIWSVLQEKVYHSRITDLEELKTRLIDEWAQLDQLIVDAAIGQWRRRLHSCVRARGAHFEHKFWQCWADMSWN